MQRLPGRRVDDLQLEYRAWWSKWISTFGISSGDASVQISFAPAVTYVWGPFSNGAFRLATTGPVGIATIDW